MIGRNEELKTLQELLSSNKPEFVALYGRRRVGKTYLIKEFFNNTFSFYVTGVQNSTSKMQLRIFKEALVKYGDKNKAVPKDWFEAFARLEQLLQSNDVYTDYASGKKIVFLDELPWMDSPRSDFKSALDYFWNSWGSSEKDLILIVCGSATSWIINNIVKDTGGFYNRLTKQIRLMPFNLSECQKFLESNNIHFNRKQIVESYMIFGGIPYYLNYLKPGYSLAQNIEMLFFHENGPLRYEFDQLFKALFRNSQQYIDIIRELSKTKYGRTRNELLESGKTVTGKELTACLENLEQCGFIRKYTDFKTPKNGCHFQLIDPLCLFYLHFIENERIDSWLGILGTPKHSSWCGLAFEKVCLQHTNQMKKALGISGITSREFSWSSKNSTPGAQIDLIIDRNDEVINICEMKYYKEAFTINSKYEDSLNYKLATLQKETNTPKALWITLITFAGLNHNEHSGNVICELTADDLFTE